jgi:hypothetical protein
MIATAERQRQRGRKGDAREHVARWARMAKEESNTWLPTERDKNVNVISWVQKFAFK